MLKLPGYFIHDRIYLGARSAVFRANRKRDGVPVMVKIPSAGLFLEEDLERFKREFGIGRQFKNPHVVQYIELESHHHELAIITEDFNARGLTTFVPEEGMDLELFLNIAIQLADGLAAIHALGVTHKDIKPGNIVFNPHANIAKYIDFGAASELDHETQQAMSPNRLEGTLAFLSPEQTGRMNRDLDYRTDFYSLGVSLYFMLAGHLPFQCEQALEMLHCHLARSPVPLHDLRNEVPPVLSDMVQRLMSKNAEDRYQSASGLRYDLETCQKHLKESGFIPAFALARRDLSTRFFLPNKLYGREREIQAISEVFQRVKVGSQTQFVILSGTSGIGKSSLGFELQKEIIAARGYFLAGKFDLLKRDVPYSAFIYAIQGLIRQLLMERAEVVENWKARIQAAVGVNGQVIIDVIPGVELLIGPQPAVTELPLEEAQARFNLTMRRFIRAFSKREKPVVLFLDDLQWAGKASLKLLEQFMEEEQEGNLLLLASLRVDEPEADEMRAQILALSESVRERILEIQVQPLAVEDVSKMLADALHQGEAAVAQLASIVAKKTGANPFFIRHFLKSLYLRKLIHYDVEMGQWCWETEQIRTVGVTENVVDLLVSEFELLPETTRACLSRAACIGNVFDLRTLAAVEQRPKLEVAQRIWPALHEGFISAQESQMIHRWDLLIHDKIQSEVPGNLSFRFCHDRIYQTAYDLQDPSNLPQIHLEIGRLLLKNLEQQEGGELFEVLNHLLRGRHLMRDPAELNRLVVELVRSGKKAMGSADFQTADHNFTRAMELLPPHPWENAYELCFELYLAFAACEWLLNRTRESEASYNLLLNKSRNLEDRARVYIQRVQDYNGRNLPREAIGIGLEGLKLFDVLLSSQPSQAAVNFELFRSRWYLGRRGFDDLAKAPEMENGIEKAKLQLMHSICPSLYVLGQRQLLTLVALKMVNTSLKHGNSESAAFAFSIMGLITGACLGDPVLGFNYGEFGHRLIRRYRQPLLSSRIHYIFGAFIQRWRLPISRSREILMEGYRAGLEAGDAFYPGWCLYYLLLNNMLQGQDLRAVERELGYLLNFLHRNGVVQRIELMVLTRQYIRNLIGQTEDPRSFASEDFNEETFVGKLVGDEHQGTLQFYYMVRCWHAYLSGEYRQGLQWASRVELETLAIMGSPANEETLLIQALCLTCSLGFRALKDTTRAQKALRSMIRKMRAFAKACPDNFRHMLLLLEAEVARLKGESAADLYDRAIRSAMEQGFILHAALANEIASKYWHARDKDHIAALYASEAYIGFRKVGMVWKVKEMEERSVYLRRPLLHSDNAHALMPGPMAGFSRTSSSYGGSSDAVDLATLAGTIRDLTSEIQIGPLQAIIIRRVLESAGAQKGFLLMRHEDELLIEASADAETGKVEVELGGLLDNARDLATSIVRYVFRSQEEIVLKDAASSGMFLRDGYIVIQQPKSILCLPMIYKEEILGIIYLENNLMTDAFTAQRVIFIKTLLAQAAISMETARLYGKTFALNRALEREVEERKLAETEVRQLNADLENRVEQRTEELRETQRELIEKAHKAGMADIAISVLHNVGNVLNSAITSSEVMKGALETSKMHGLGRANQLLRQNQSDLAHFFTQDPKGRMLIEYFLKLEEQLQRENLVLQDNLKRVLNQMELIRDVIYAQQNHVADGFYAEKLAVKDVVEAALQIVENSLTGQGVQMERHFEELPNITFQKTKLMHVLLNIYKNAIEAMSNSTQKRIEIWMGLKDHAIEVRIGDSGSGIEKDQLQKVFLHGYTTKQGRFGFGLHSSANFMTEMGGDIWAESEGQDKGAVFVLRLPLDEIRAPRMR